MSAGRAEHVDILVLGSGEGGKYLAWYMAKSGHRTAVVERRWIGGSCPNINCLTNSFKWDGQAWIGTDTNRLWLKSEALVDSSGTVSDGLLQILYSRPITTYFDAQAGIRLDLDSGPSRVWGAFGIQGLAPQFFELQVTGFVRDAGHFAAKVEASYDLLLTQRLILQPEIELNFYSKSDRARGIGPGLADMDAGLRLRYELIRKLAPYIGVVYEGKFGDTARFARRQGEGVSDVRFVFGIRSWF